MRSNFLHKKLRYYKVISVARNVLWFWKVLPLQKRTVLWKMQLWLKQSQGSRISVHHLCLHQQGKASSDLEFRNLKGKVSRISVHHLCLRQQGKASLQLISRPAALSKPKLARLWQQLHLSLLRPALTQAKSRHFIVDKKLGKHKFSLHPTLKLCLWPK